MKRLAIVLAVIACASVSGGNSGDSSFSVTIPGVSMDQVRAAVASQPSSKGYSIVSSDDSRINGEKPASGDVSGYFFDARSYRIGETRSGIIVMGSGQLIDRRSAAIRTYDPRVESMRMGIENTFPADLAALKRQLTQ